jgi:hypothetical protein
MTVGRRLRANFRHSQSARRIEQIDLFADVAVGPDQEIARRGTAGWNIPSVTDDLYFES